MQSNILREIEHNFVSIDEIAGSIASLPSSAPSPPRSPTSGQSTSPI